MKEQVQEVAREKIKKFWLGQTKTNKLKLLVLTTLLVLIVFPAAAFGLIYRDSIYPGVMVAGINASGMKFDELAHQLSVKSRDYRRYEKFVVVDDSGASEAGTLLWETDLEELEVEFDPIQTSQNAYDYGRSGDLWQNVQNIWVSVISGEKIPNSYGYSKEKLESLLEQIASDVDKPGAPANIVVSKDAVEGSKIEVFLGENGVVVDRDKLKREFENKLSKLDYGQTTLPLSTQNNVIDERQGESAKIRAEKLIEKELVVLVDDETTIDRSWKLEGDDLVAFLNISGGFSSEKISEYVLGLKEAVDRPPQNALFKFENGRVLEFAPGLPGLLVDENSSVGNIIDSLTLTENTDEAQTAKLVLVKTDPEIKTPDVNDLGIKELIGRGESTYFHSIPGRVFNVAHTANKLNGVLIPPGETFSFNQTIGDISAATGFKSAYVIKDGRTVLGDGGGVCQDSTTLFRAVMDAGLPVSERKGHSYRVGYYEQNSEPGFDATVFSPSVDFKFKNDTPAHILIQAKADSANYSLVIELYGTSDGRVSEISNYQKWGAVPAPPPLYQDDPSLAPGVIRQVDWAASGLKTKFDYKVTRGGETIFEKTFYTTYQPWRAIYLRGI